MRKFLSILLIAVLILSAVPAIAASPAVTVGSANASAGETVEIPIILSNNAGFSSLGIEIGYDASVLTLKGAASSVSGATFTTAQELTANPYNLGWDAASDIVFNGTLAVLTFEVTGGSGEYAITVDYFKGRDGDYVDGDDVNYNADYEPLGLSYVNGKITVSGGETPADPDNAPTVKVSSVTASGETVEIPIILSNNAGFASLGVEIGYDAAALELVAVKSDVSGATFTTAAELTANPYNLGWDAASDITFNGTLAVLTFKVKGSAGEYPITVDYYKGRDGGYADGDDVNYNADYEPLDLSYVNGKITVLGGSVIEISEDDGVITAAANASGVLIIAQYGEDGSLVAIKTQEVGIGESITAQKEETAKRFAAYLWDSFDNMQPVTK